MKDVRDDILHRTAFGQKRAVTLPDLVDVLRAGGGQSPFLRGGDFRGYVGGVLVRIFALACLADDFVRSSISVRHAGLNLPPRSGILFTADEIDSAGADFAARFEPGTFIVSVSEESFESLHFFIEAGESTDSAV